MRNRLDNKAVCESCLLLAKKIPNWNTRQICVAAASAGCQKDPQLGSKIMYQQHPLVAEKILNWVMRLYHWRLPVAEKDPQLVTRLQYQQHQPVTEKILNWVTRLCTSSIQQLLKRDSIGLQDCVLGGTADMMDVARYSEITITTTTTTSDKNTHYHSPSSCLLLQKCMCVKTQQKKPACAIHQRSLHKPTTVDSVRTMHVCV